MVSRRRFAPVLVLVLAGVVGCGGEGAGTSSSTSTTSAGSTEEASRIVLGARVDLGGDGLLGAHPRFPLAYVSVPEAGERGCEGAPAPALWSVGVDGEDLRRALPTPALRLVAGQVRAGGVDGQVVVVDQCEGFLTDLVVGVPGPDGVVGGARRIEPQLDAFGEAELVPSTIGWSADGRSLLAVVQASQPDDAPSPRVDHIVRIGLDGRTREVASAISVLGAVELDDGTIVRASNETVRIGDAPTVPVAVSSLVVAPDRRRVAVFGDDGVHLLEPGLPLERLSTDRAAVGSWSPDGRRLAYLHQVTEDRSAVEVLDVETGRRTRIDGQAGFATPVFTPDGGTLLYARAVDGGEGYDLPRPTARRLRR